MRFFMRKPAAVRDAGEAPKEGGSSFAFGQALAHYDPANDPNQFLSDEDMAVFVALFQRSGFRGGGNWYRNFSRNWQASADLPTRIDGGEVAVVAILALALSFLATLYPAWRAARVDPVEALRNV